MGGDTCCMWFYFGAKELDSLCCFRDKVARLDRKQAERNGMFRFHGS